MSDGEGMNIDEKLEAVRARVHNMNDTIQKLVGDLSEHSIYITALKERVDKLTADVATGEQLDAVKDHLLLQLTIAKTQLEGSVSEIKLKVLGVSDKLDPIQRGIYWLVALIVGAVLLALMGLVLKPR